MVGQRQYRRVQEHMAEEVCAENNQHLFDYHIPVAASQISERGRTSDLAAREISRLRSFQLALLPLRQGRACGGTKAQGI